MYDYFETENAVYSIINGKHYIHMKEWDSFPSFRYHVTEITVSEYVKAYRKKSA